jgi:hypothetical protein
MNTIVLACLVGGILGLGVFALIRAVTPSRRSAVSTVAQIDALRASGATSGSPSTVEAEGPRALLGRRVAAFYLQRGWEQGSLRADLSVLDRSWEAFLATKTLLAAAGLVFGPTLVAVGSEIGFEPGPVIPVWLAVMSASAFFLLPDLEVRRDAASRRKDLRRVISAYLDLVSMNLSGGRGLPEALTAAAEISDGWALARIRNCLADARITGTSQWVALGRLGAELGIEELQDLGGTLALVADDGAKIRESLAARAETMRHRELSEIEGEAGEQSQSMLVAQMLLAAGFLVFLIFPAAMRVFQV